MPSDPRHPKKISMQAYKEAGQLHSVWSFSLEVSPFDQNGWGRLALNAVACVATSVIAT